MEQFFIGVLVSAAVLLFFYVSLGRDQTAFGSDKKVTVSVITSTGWRPIAYECTGVIEIEDDSLEFLNEHGLRVVISGVGYMLEEEPKQ